MESVNKTIPHSSKELKHHVRPEFEKNWETIYPTPILKKYGYERKQCRMCHHFFWTCDPKRDVWYNHLCTIFFFYYHCEGQYTFVGEGCGIGKKRKITYQEAWDGFEQYIIWALF